MMVCERNIVMCELQADDAEEEEVYTDSSAFLKVFWNIHKQNSETAVTWFVSNIEIKYFSYNFMSITAIVLILLHCTVIFTTRLKHSAQLL